MQLPHLASRLYGTPLLVARSKLDIILAVLGDRIGWPEPQAAFAIPPLRAQPDSPPGIAVIPVYGTLVRRSVGLEAASGLTSYGDLGAMLDAAVADPAVTGILLDIDSPGGEAGGVFELAQPDSPPGIAVIPVYGTLVRRSVGLEAASGLTSYGDLGAMLDAAVADPAVTGILLDIDSPGGEAGGVFELAQRVRAADAVKPVWAIASDTAFSAAYAIACAASRVYVTQTGGVGSIGVIAMHVDQSARDAQQGYRYTAITAGDQKNDLSPHQPLDKEASARLQTEVDRLYGIFVEHVAAMRTLEPRFVRSTQAGVYFGPEAVTAGLADAQGSFDTALIDFSSFLSARRSRNAAAKSTSGMSVSAQPVKELHMKLESTAVPGTSDVPGITDAPIPTQAPSPQPTVVPTTDDVVDEAVQAATKAARADAVAIAELCQLAGQPQRIATFLAEGASESHVRRVLLASRAESPEITSVIHPDAAAKAASPEQNPLMKAVKKLTGKD